MTTQDHVSVFDYFSNCAFILLFLRNSQISQLSEMILREMVYPAVFSALLYQETQWERRHEDMLLNWYMGGKKDVTDIQLQIKAHFN